MTEESPNGALALQTVAMPAETNANGDIFGGWLMAQMDIAASVVARARANGRTATVAVEAMQFLEPVHVGDVVSIYGDLAREGRTSMKIDVEVWVTRHLQKTRVKVTEGQFIFVAIDDHGKKRPLPQKADTGG